MSSDVPPSNESDKDKKLTIYDQAVFGLVARIKIANPEFKNIQIKKISEEREWHNRYDISGADSEVIDGFLNILTERMKDDQEVKNALSSGNSVIGSDAAESTTTASTFDSGEDQEAREQQPEEQLEQQSEQQTDEELGLTTAESAKAIYEQSTEAENSYYATIASCENLDGIKKKILDRITQLKGELEDVKQVLGNEELDNNSLLNGVAQQLGASIGSLEQELAAINAMAENQDEAQVYLEFKKEEAQQYIAHREGLLKNWDEAYSKNQLPKDVSGNIDVAKLEEWQNKFKEMFFDPNNPTKTWGDVRKEIYAKFAAMQTALSLKPFIERIGVGFGNGVAHAYYYALGVASINQMANKSGKALKAAANSTDPNRLMSPEYIKTKLNRKHIWFMDAKVFKLLEPSQVAALREYHFNNRGFRYGHSRNILNILVKAGKLGDIDPVVFGKIHSALLKDLPTDKITEDQARNINKYQFNRFDFDQIEKLAHADKVRPYVLRNITTEKFAAFLLHHLKDMSAAQFNGLRAGRYLPYPRDGQITLIPADQIKEIKPEVFSKIEVKQIRSMEAPQIEAAAEAGLLTIKQLNGLYRGGRVHGTSMIRAITPKSMAKLIIANKGFEGLDPKQIAKMKPEQFSFPELSTKTPAEIEIAAYFNNLTGAQLRAIPPAAFAQIPIEVRKLFDSAVVAQMSSTQMTAFRDSYLEAETQTIPQEQLDAIDNYKNQAWIPWAMNQAISAAVGTRAINLMTPQDIRNASIDPKNRLHQDNIAKTTGFQIFFTNASVFQELNKDQVGAFKSIHFNTMFAKGKILESLKPEQCCDIDPKTFGGIYPSVLAKATPNTIDNEGNTVRGQISYFTKKQFEQLTTSRVFARNPLNKWNEQQIQSISIDGHEPALTGIPPNVIKKTKSDQVSLFSAEQFSKFTRDQFRAITVKAFIKIAAVKFGQIAPEALANARIKQIEAIDENKCKNITVEQLNALANKNVRSRLGYKAPLIQYIKPELIKEIPVHVLNGYASADSQVKVDSKFLGQLSKEQLTQLILCGNFNELEPDSLKEVDPKVLWKLPADVLGKIAPKQFANFSPEQVAAMRVNSPNTALNSITEAQFRGLGENIKHIHPKSLALLTEEFGWLDPKQIPHLTEKQLGKLKAGHFEHANLEQLLAFSPEQLEKLNATQLGLIKLALGEQVRTDNSDKTVNENELEQIVQAQMKKIENLKRIVNAGAAMYESNWDATKRRASDAGNTLYAPIGAAVSAVKTIHNVLWAKNATKLKTPAKLSPTEAAIKDFFKSKGLSLDSSKVKKIAGMVEKYGSPELLKTILESRASAPAFPKNNISSLNVGAFCQNAITKYEKFAEECKKAGLVDDKKISAAFMYAQKTPGMQQTTVITAAVRASASNSSGGSNVVSLVSAINAVRQEREAQRHQSLQQQQQQRVQPLRIVESEQMRARLNAELLAEGITQGNRTASPGMNPRR